MIENTEEAKVPGNGTQQTQHGQMYPVPGPVFEAIMQVLNQLPRGQVNQLCTVLEQIRPIGK